MHPWHLIANDHANIVGLCRDILRAAPGDGAMSRDRLFDELDGELRRHIQAEERSLYHAIEDHGSASPLIDELERQHDEIHGRLDRLARARDKGSRTWAQEFEDLSYLLDRHFYREEHELVPMADRVLKPHQVRNLQHAFAEEKIEQLREARQGLWGDIPTGALIGIAVAGAAAAVALTAWRRGGSLDGLLAGTPLRRLSEVPVFGRMGDYLGGGDEAVHDHEMDVLLDIADHTRCPVQDVSSRLELPIGRTFGIVAALERDGLVRSRYEQQAGRERMVAAITSRGREVARR